MALSFEELRRILEGERLPAAVVDLDALDRNVDRVVATVRPHRLPIRVASKSIRVVALLRRILSRGAGAMRGVMAYSVEEAEHLAAAGLDDLLVAYPPFQRAEVERAARLTADGIALTVVADGVEGIRRLSEVGQAHGVEITVVLCADMSWRLAGGRVHLGVRRSPLHEPDDVVELARLAEREPGVRFGGIMGYEAQVAGLGDDSPFAPLLNPFKTLVRKGSMRELSARRRAMVEALAAAGLPPALVNGGGSGSLGVTTRRTGVTEVTAGSAFLKPHLFDYYKDDHMQRLEPACFFALEVTRRPAPGVVTCLGGGYIASGPAGPDKLPLPWLPRGLSLLAEEGCGEVQTPLRLPAGTTMALGDPVIFRHAKGGELAERFSHYLLVERGELVGRVPTYRGEGRCFF